MVWTLKHAAAELNADRVMVRVAVKQDGGALQHAAAELIADRGIVREPVKQNGWVLKHGVAVLKHCPGVGHTIANQLPRRYQPRVRWKVPALLASVEEVQLPPRGSRFWRTLDS